MQGTIGKFSSMNIDKFGFTLLGKRRVSDIDFIEIKQ